MLLVLLDGAGMGNLSGVIKSEFQHSTHGKKEYLCSVLDQAMQKLIFELDKEFIELNKLIKFMGITETGGSAKMLVAAGEVLVDGAVELRKACKIRAGQTVETGDVQIKVVAATA